MNSVCILIIFVNLILNLNAEQFIIESPLDQQARIGDRALLKCKIKNLRGEPQWCIDDFCLGVHKKEPHISNQTESSNSHDQMHLKGRPRYRIVGDRSKGEFHLLIEPVQLQDNMYFYCMVTAASETIKAVKSKKVFLTVLTYPQSLGLDNPVHVSLNKPSTIQCKAKQSRPPVKILISINGNLITDESKYKTEIIQYPILSSQEDENINDPKKRFSYVTSISSISAENLRQSYYDTITNLTIDDITMKMQGQLVECFAYSIFNANSNHFRHHPNTRLNSHNSNVMSTKSLIQVDYAPEVNLKIVSLNKILKEEDVISLVCETKATPPIQSYKWYIGKSYLSGVSDSNLNLKLRREMHLKTITCEASNTVASVKASLQLKILFKPSFLKGPKSYMLIDKSACNKPLTLDCQVNSNPQSNITWFRRRLNQAYLNLNSIKNFQDLNEIFQDEPIGSGPTYTIASFNCGNLLDNIRNQSKPSIIKKEFKRFQRDTQENQEQDEDIYDTDYLDKSEQPEYYYDYDESENVDGLNFDPDKSENSILYENNDFGVYLCEAANKLMENKQFVRRYIKLNAIGAPVVKVMPSSVNSLSTDEMMSLMMKTSLTEPYTLNENLNQIALIEIASSVGNSVSLTCLIEPLPYLESIVWIKDNGRIIPNSRYSILESYKESSKQMEESSTQSALTTVSSLIARNSKNFKIKHENLTISSYAKETDENLVSSLQSTSSPILNINGVKSTDVENVGLTRSILHIKNIRKQDFGIYKCKSTNSYGSRTAMILLRERNLLDKFNLNSYGSFMFVLASIAFVFLMLMFFLVCIVSSRIRRKLCCCCSRSTKSLREKNLLKCDLNSDKSISDWLAASSKLSNETNGTGCLLNTAVSTNNSGSSSSTTTNILNDPLLLSSTSSPCKINLSNKSTSSSKSSSKTIQTSTNSPRHELTANCSSLLNDDNSEENYDDDNITKQSLKLNSFQQNQARYLISSTGTTTSTNSSSNDYDNTENSKTLMLVKSSNGNFNAKITSKPSLADLNYTLNTKKDQFRLSDLFNELSPSLIVNNNNSSNQSPSKFPNPFTTKQCSNSTKFYSNFYRDTSAVSNLITEQQQQQQYSYQPCKHLNI